MKTLLWAILCLCFALSVVPALSQEAPSQGATEDSGGRGDWADKHHGHSSGGWRQIEVRNRPKSLECGQSGNA
jgi:hypothetical protein